jgi:PKD repeat protein
LTLLAPASPITVTDYVTLTLGTFIPANGSVFNNLSVGPGSTLSIPSGAGITINGTYTNTGGTADVSQLTLHLAGDGSGTVKANPKGTLFDTGTIVTLTASPAPGSRFFRWAGDVVGSTNPATVTLSADRVVTGTFVPIAGVLPVNTSPLVVQQTTNFTATLSGDNALNCTWDFGDGTPPGAGLTASHTYTQVGTYLATVTGTSFTNTVTATTTVVVGDTLLPVGPALDAELVYTTTQGRLPVTATLQLPAGAAAGADTLVFTEIPTSTHPLSSSLKFAGLNFSLSAYVSQTLQAGFHFQVPVTLTLAYAATGLRPDDEATFNLRHWNGTTWATDGITLIQRDTVNHQLVYTLDHLSDYSITERGTSLLYLPLVLQRYAPGPDLIVQHLAITPNGGVQVVIKNQGDAPVTSEFWVEVYVNPSTPPTHVNQSWPLLGSQGLTWGVTNVALSQLRPGGMLTLTVNDPYYVAAYSQLNLPLTAGTPVYAQVDSVDHATTYGAVLENHEMIGGPYNNITGPVSVAAADEIAPLEAQPITHLPGDGDTLPTR